MPKFEQLQKRPQRHRRGDSVPSTFPEDLVRANGDPGNDTDDFLEKVTEVLDAHEDTHEQVHEEARHQLGHLGLAAS